MIVLQTLPGTPSAKAGLAPGDEILGINGYVIARLDLDQLQELLTAPGSARPQLEVHKPGLVAHRFLHADAVPNSGMPSVERAFFHGAGIGYIRHFNLPSPTEPDASPIS